MTIDERLEFLRQSTESLHASCQELHATVARQADEAEAQRAEAKEQRERDSQYIKLIADVFKHWGNGGSENGEA